MIDHEIHLRWWLNSEDHHASTLSQSVTWLLSELTRLRSERDAAVAETARVVRSHRLHVEAIEGAMGGLNEAVGRGVEG